MFNLLDTPGHEDFSEDTYRTLTAADAAVMVLDAAKGIEPQTLKLFEVCRLRDIPIVTFINKMDREAQDPFALLDEIASKLALDPAPLYWPAGSGGRFKGMLDLRAASSCPSPRRAPTASRAIRRPSPSRPTPSQLPRPRRAGGARGRRRAGAGRADQALRPAILPGRPHDAGVLRLGAAPLRRRRSCWRALGAYAPPPRPQPREGRRRRQSRPATGRSSGFVFKVQANMDPNHRDRDRLPAALPPASSARGMKLKVQNTGRSSRQRADHVLRLRPRAGRGGLRRRRHRHPQPRRAAGRRQPARRAGPCASPACPTSRRRSCSGCGSRIRSRPST